MKVRDAIKLIEDDGWFQVVTRGSHRQFNIQPSPGASPSPASRPTTLHPAHLEVS
jgi:hypothetical protein